jgi:hypothetical protein
VAIVLLVLGGLAVVAADVAVWVRGIVMDRESFVTALRPLADDEDLLDGLTVELTDRVLGLQPVAGRSDADELRPLIEEALGVVMAGPLFDTMWTDAARLAHDQVVRLVREGGDEVRLDLGELLTRVDDLLEAGGHDILDEDRIERIDDVVVTTGDRVAQAIDAIAAVEQLGLVLPFVALALFAGAVVLARRRGLAIGLVGVATAAGALVALALAFAARSWIVGRVDAGARRRAVGDVWDGLVDPLHRQSYVLLAIGVAVAVGAAVASRMVAATPDP